MKSIQYRLNEGETPSEIVNSGVAVEELYGKEYQGGLIFYLNTDDGTGMVAATEDQSTGAKWGCYGTDITGLANVPWNGGVPEGTGAEIGNGAANTTAILMECAEDGIAAKLCRDLGEEWFSPSIKELNLMYTNLHQKGHGGFAADFYWSSTEGDSNFAWLQIFLTGFQPNFSKFLNFHVRAARAF